MGIGYREILYFAAIMAYDNQYIQNPKSKRRYGKKIHRQISLAWLCRKVCHDCFCFSDEGLGLWRMYLEIVFGAGASAMFMATRRSSSLHTG